LLSKTGRLYSFGFTGKSLLGRPTEGMNSVNYLPIQIPNLSVKITLLEEPEAKSIKQKQNRAESSS
jgi:hypothetical protein